MVSDTADSVIGSAAVLEEASRFLLEETSGEGTSLKYSWAEPCNPRYAERRVRTGGSASRDVFSDLLRDSAQNGGAQSITKKKECYHADDECKTV